MLMQAMPAELKQNLECKLLVAEQLHATLN